MRAEEQHRQHRGCSHPVQTADNPVGKAYPCFHTLIIRAGDEKDKHEFKALQPKQPPLSNPSAACGAPS
jgi:hypothetical protein